MRNLLIILIFFAVALKLSSTATCSVVSNAGAGTVQISSAGAVTGTSTTFSSVYVGSQICVSGTCAWITAFTSSTAVTVGGGAWSGTVASGQSYTILQTQLMYPTNSTNNIVFPNNFQAGSILLFGAVVDGAGADQLYSATTGSATNSSVGGEPFRLTKYSTPKAA